MDTRLIRKHNEIELYEECHRRFWYDETTGSFVYKIRVSRTNVGARAGKIHVNGEGRICGYTVEINNKSHYTHRLIWLMQTGELPELLVDHEDRNPLNNKWSNLRLATAAQNSQNRPANNISVNKLKNGNFSYTVEIKNFGKRYYKTFKTYEEADNLRKELKKERGVFEHKEKT